MKEKDPEYRMLHCTDLGERQRASRKDWKTVVHEEGRTP